MRSTALPEIPEAVLRELYREFCLARFAYDGPYVSDETREGHIEADARSYCGPHTGPQWRTPLSVLVDAAYRAGRQSAYTEEEWRVVAMANTQLPAKFQFREIYGEAEDEAGAREDLADAIADSWASPWIERRRTGATEWKRVDDV